MSRTSEIYQANRQVIPGGVVSLNRALHKEVAFVRAVGSRMWDADGREYIDYHLGFAASVLGHNDPDVNSAVVSAIDSDRSLFGAGTTPWEGDVAGRVVNAIPSVDKVQLTNTGSEATYHALRVARAHTGRDDIIIMQGGYNGWHNDVAANLMTPLEVVGPRVSPGEYRFAPITAGVPRDVGFHVHVVNFNDIDSVRYVMGRYPVAAVILEPILQNIGVVKPAKGYLARLRDLCDEEGALLVFDEVKTGFRYALGGYQSIAGVAPDLSTFGKAISNGYPMGVIGGRAELMAYFIHPDPAKRVMIAGTFNAHPVACAAGIATIDKLAAEEGAAYRALESLGRQMDEGLQSIFLDAGIPITVAREGSAYCVYFMDHAPVDWHDLLANNDVRLDQIYREALIDEGVFHFPLSMKQGSISLAHSAEDVAITLDKTRAVVKKLPARTRTNSQWKGDRRGLSHR